MKTSKILALTTLILIVNSFPGWASERPEFYRELKIGTGWDATRPGDFQPMGMWEPACIIYESLVNLDAENRPVPCLAKKWEVSPDGLVYTFCLEEGVRFHDGTPLNAEAVIINFEKLGPMGWQPLYGAVDSLSAEGPLIVRFALKRPVPLFFIHLAGSKCGIVAPSVIVPAKTTGTPPIAEVAKMVKKGGQDSMGAAKIKMDSQRAKTIVQRTAQKAVYNSGDMPGEMTMLEKGKSDGMPMDRNMVENGKPDGMTMPRNMGESGKRVGMQVTPTRVEIEKADGKPMPRIMLARGKSGDMIMPRTLMENGKPGGMPMKRNMVESEKPSGMPPGMKKGMMKAKGMGAMCSYVVARPVGTGPYKWEAPAYRRAESFSVGMNESYRQGKPVFERITWLVIPDPSARAIALETGEIHMTGQSPNAALTEENVIALRRSDTIRLVRDNNWGARLVLINHTRPPFDRPGARKALAHAVDFEAIQALLTEMALVCPGPLGPGTSFAHPSNEFPEYNPVKARALLDAAGLKDTNGNGIREFDGKDISIRITTAKSGALGVLICEYLNKVGLEAAIRPREGGSVFEVLRRMDFDLAVHPNIPSFYLELYHTFHSGGRWSVNLNDPEIDALLDRHMKTSDMEAFIGLGHRIQEKIREKGIILLGINESKIVAYDKRLGEFMFPPEEWVGSLQEIWKIK